MNIVEGFVSAHQRSGRPWADGVTFRAVRRLPGMQDQRVGRDLIWTVLFLAVAFALVISSLGWLAFGSGIS